MTKGRILAVDDQRYFRELLEALLCEEGYEVTTAEGGREALERIQQEDFDVVVSDLVMPEIDGSALVERIRQFKADQEIVIVTGAADVTAAANAMKLGASDFILKPFDRATLIRSLDRLMQQKLHREEHAELIARNLEYMSALSLYERATGLFSAPGIEALSERLLDALCMETRGQGGVLWLTHELGESHLRLASARGIVRGDREPEELILSQLPEIVASELRAGRSHIMEEPMRSSLCVPLRDGERLLGVVRISDKLENAQFGETDRAQADRFTQIASPAVATALRIRSLERRSFRDPVTGAYSQAYLHDVAHNEIRKAARFGRPLSLVRVALTAVAEPSRPPSPAERERWLEGSAVTLGSLLRATDLMAVHEDGTIEMLLPETDGIGAATLKHRLIGLLSELEDEKGAKALPVEIALASCAYPADGSELKSLLGVLDARIQDHLASPARRFERSEDGLSSILAQLRSEGGQAPACWPAQVTEFLCHEIARRPTDRALLFARPEASFGWETQMRQLAKAIKGEAPHTQIVVLCDADADEREALASLQMTWASPGRLGDLPPFLVYCGEGPSYVAIGGDGEDSFFHSADRALAEHLSLRVQRELGVGASGA